MNIIRWMIEALVSAVYVFHPYRRVAAARTASQFRRVYRMNRLRMETYTYQMLTPLARSLQQVGRRERKPRQSWV